MARMTAGQAIVEVMRRAGVRRIFGVPGESFLGVLDALYDAPIGFVATRHEGGAAAMASGYAKISGEVGVCMGTRAVGASNLAIGIHTARHDSTPMLALAGQVPRRFKGRDAFQELDLVAVFSHYCKWAAEVDDPARAAELTERALLLARSGRPGPVFLALPEDVLAETAEVAFGHPGPPAPPQPDPVALGEMLAALLAAERPAILAGGGVLSSPGAYAALVEFAEAVEVPVITAWRRHDAFPNDHRLSLGSASLGQPGVVWERLRACDVLLAIGTRFQQLGTRGYTLPAPATRVLLVDVEPTSATGIAIERRLVADAGAALRQLIERLPRPVPGVGGRRERNRADREAYLAATAIKRVAVRSGTVDPAAVMATLAAALPPEAIVATDAGNFYGWLSRYYRFRRPHTYVGPTSGAMGYGLPAAIGAKLARPQAPVVCLAGDGGYMMAVQELETAVRCRANVVSIVLDNALYGTIRFHQEREHPGRVVGTELTTPDLGALAAAFGARGYRARTEAEFDEALRDALAAEVPSLIHVLVDPEHIAVDVRLSEAAGKGREG